MMSVSRLVGAMLTECAFVNGDFLKIVEELLLLHGKKVKDYGPIDAPDGNLRAGEKFGISASKAIFVRMNDKMSRLAEFARTGSLANESVEDSLMDLANYALLALFHFRREMGPRQNAPACSFCHGPCPAGTTSCGCTDPKETT